MANALNMKWRKTILSTLTKTEIESPRVLEVVKIIGDIHKSRPNEKTLVFSKFLRFLNLVDRAIEFKFGESQTSFRVLRFDGTVHSSRRQGLLQEMERSTRQPTIMLLSAGCGGAALNIAFASHVVICEPWWRGGDVEQAVGRAYREGQEKQVRVYHVMGDDSVVDHLLIKIRKAKEKVIKRLMKALRRRDDEPPGIPIQYAGLGGENQAEMSQVMLYE